MSCLACSRATVTSSSLPPGNRRWSEPLEAALAIATRLIPTAERPDWLRRSSVARIIRVLGAEGSMLMNLYRRVCVVNACGRLFLGYSNFSLLSQQRTAED